MVTNCGFCRNSHLFTTNRQINNSNFEIRMTKVKLIECPRDAMQGIKAFIPTSLKVKYIQSLLGCGFDTIDFGSFVSPKAIPQMIDTAEVLSMLDLTKTSSKLLAIAESVETLKTILQIAKSTNKEVVTYISMGFGNPYGDPWNVEIVGEWTERLAEMGARIVSLSDTVGTSNPETIKYLFSNLIPKYPEIEFGAHLHTTPSKWHEKVNAAYNAGCRRFDGAIQGFGGCPMAKDELTGNMPTEKMLSYFTTAKADSNVNAMVFEASYNKATELFSSYH